jgi:hypothetical protein
MTNSNSSSIPTMGAILEADEQGTVVTALKTALELDVFEIVAKGPQSAEEIAGAASCSVRGMSVLLDALCVKGLLDKKKATIHWRQPRKRIWSAAGADIVSRSIWRGSRRAKNLSTLYAREKRLSISPAHRQKTFGLRMPPRTGSVCPSSWRS